MAQYSFGTGTLFGRKIPASGVVTPVKFGAIQGATIDLAFSTKELYSKTQFPVDIARGTAKVTGKAQFAQLNGLAFNDIFFGNTSLGTGSRRTVVEEARTVTANAIVPTFNTGFIRDLGINYASTGNYLDRVAAGPLVGQYTCNETTGNYTFNSADNAVNMKVSYQYTDASNGKTVTINNQLLGNSPTFLMVLTNTYKGKEWTLELTSCISAKLSIATKVEDHTIPDLDFTAFADASDVVGYLSTSE